MRRILRISLVLIIVLMVSSVARAGVDVSLDVEAGASPAQEQGSPGGAPDSNPLPLTGTDALRLLAASLTLIAIGSIFSKNRRGAEKRSGT